MAPIDLNADLGETVDGAPTADDEAMFAVVSSASVACGGHAGDARSMTDAVARAARHGVAVGAHPSYPDRAGFGRRRMEIDVVDLRQSVIDQLSALTDAGADIRYVKPHGALYHAVIEDPEAAAAVIAATLHLADRRGRAIPVLGIGGVIERLAVGAGLPFFAETFLDRGYRADGRLVPRGEPGALLSEPDIVAARAVRIARDGEVDAADGSIVRVAATSLCVHGDTAGAVALARAVRAALDLEGVEVRAPW